MLVMGSLVAFAPSSGAAGVHAPVHMPDVVGKTRAETFAIMAADQLFFTTRGSGSNNGSWVRVIAQYPAAGTLVPFRSTVALTVTVGVVHEPLPAPNLIGKSRAQVYSIMKAYQLYFTTSGPGASNGTWKSVVGQTPFADTLIKWHSFMHLTVSRAVPHPKVAVPHVVGDTRAEAIAAFNAAQISFNAQGPGAANNTWNKVLGVSPAPGTLVAWHAVVTLRVTTTTTTPTTTTSTTASRNDDHHETTDHHDHLEEAHEVKRLPHRDRDLVLVHPRTVRDVVPAPRHAPRGARPCDRTGDCLPGDRPRGLSRRSRGGPL